MGGQVWLFLLIHRNTWLLKTLCMCSVNQAKSRCKSGLNAFLWWHSSSRMFFWSPPTMGSTCWNSVVFWTCIPGQCDKMEERVPMKDEGRAALALKGRCCFGDVVKAISSSPLSPHTSQTPPQNHSNTKTNLPPAVSALMETKASYVIGKSLLSTLSWMAREFKPIQN